VGAAGLSTEDEDISSSVSLFRYMRLEQLENIFEWESGVSCEVLDGYQKTVGIVASAAYRFVLRLRADIG
jgi:hypothetical protein